jgi:AraC family transcriptional regulator
MDMSAQTPPEQLDDDTRIHGDGPSAPPDEIRSARCAVMSVAYLRRMGDLPPPGVPGIEVIIPGEAADAVAICIDREFFRRKAGEALSAEAAAWRVEPVGPCVAADPLMRGVADTLRTELRSRSGPSVAFLESLAGVIAIHLARSDYGSRPALRRGPGLAPDKLQRALAFIEEHLAEPLPIERLAAAVHTSPFHFARLFKQATGQPPHAYLTARRIERAKELLSDACVPLIHVAANAGFQTQGHFTEVFRRHAGMTPRQFRLHGAFQPMTKSRGPGAPDQARPFIPLE